MLCASTHKKLFPDLLLMHLLWSNYFTGEKCCKINKQCNMQIKSVCKYNCEILMTYLSVLGILYYAINSNLKFVTFACISKIKAIRSLFKPFGIINKEGKSIKCHKHSKSSLDFNSLFWVIFTVEVRPNDTHYALSHSWQYSAIKIIIVKKEKD